MDCIKASKYLDMLDGNLPEGEFHNQQVWVAPLIDLSSGGWVDSPVIKGEDGKLHALRSYVESLSCGTAYCLAGLIAVNEAPAGTVFTAQDGPGMDMQYPDGHEARVSLYARESLSLTASEAKYLFEGSNTLERMRRIVREICESQGCGCLQDWGH